MANEQFGFTLTPQITTGNPATVNDATQQNPLGIKCRWKGNVYRYVKFDNGTGDVASAAYGAAYWKELDPDGDPPVATVTSDQSDSIYGVNGVAGVFGGIVTDAYFTWIQVAGEALVLCETGTVEGQKIRGDASTDLTFGYTAVGTACIDLCYGVVKEGATTIGPTVLLQNLDW